MDTNEAAPKCCRKTFTVAAVACLLRTSDSSAEQRIYNRMSQHFRRGCCGVPTFENSHEHRKVARKSGRKTFTVAAVACLLRTSESLEK